LQGSADWQPAAAGQLARDGGGQYLAGRQLAAAFVLRDGTHVIVTQQEFLVAEMRAVDRRAGRWREAPAVALAE